jgi:hypothetical protein
MKYLILGCTVVLLNACGGSGGESNTNKNINQTLIDFPMTRVTSVTQVPLATEPQKTPDLTQVFFPFENAYKMLWAKTFLNNYSISGTCTGTASFIVGPSIKNIFEGISGFSRKDITTFSLTNCKPANETIQQITYLDDTYLPIGALGALNNSNEYIVFSQKPTLPKAIKIGESGNFANYNHYIDSSKNQQTAYTKVTYSAEQDALHIQDLPTIIIKTVNKTYNMANQEIYSYEIKYRLTQNAILNIVSMTYKDNSTNRSLVLTKISP